MICTFKGIWSSYIWMLSDLNIICVILEIPFVLPWEFFVYVIETLGFACCAPFRLQSWKNKALDFSGPCKIALAQILSLMWRFKRQENVSSSKGLTFKGLLSALILCPGTVRLTEICQTVVVFKNCHNFSQILEEPSSKERMEISWEVQGGNPWCHACPEHLDWSTLVLISRVILMMSHKYIF